MPAPHDNNQCQGLQGCLFLGINRAHRPTSPAIAPEISPDTLTTVRPKTIATNATNTRPSQGYGPYGVDVVHVLLGSSLQHLNSIAGQSSLKQDRTEMRK